MISNEPITDQASLIQNIEGHDSSIASQQK